MAGTLLTPQEARETAARLATCEGTDEIHQAMVEAAKFEYGYRWTEDHAEYLLFARLTLQGFVEGVNAVA